MSPAQKKGLQIGLQLASLTIGGAMTVAFSAATARSELRGKEDAAAHAVDIRALQDEVRDERQQRQLQQLRDSAAQAMTLTIVRDLACDQRPQRNYCGRAP